MTEMIRYLTKKFSSHTLTEVKPASHGNLRCEQDLQIKDVVDEGDIEDEEISTINLAQLADIRGQKAPQIHAKQETESRPHERLKQSPLQSKIRITPPLKQFDMRLPDIEHEPKYDYYGSVKQRRFLRNNNQMMKQLELNRQSPLIRRPAFMDYAKDLNKTDSLPRTSAFVRIPYIEGAKIHPRPAKKKESAPAAEPDGHNEKLVAEPVSAPESQPPADSDIIDVKPEEGKKVQSHSAVNVMGKKSDKKHKMDIVSNLKEKSQLLSGRDQRSFSPFTYNRNSPSPPPLQLYEYKCIPLISQTTQPIDVSDKVFSPIRVNQASPQTRTNSPPTNVSPPPSRTSPLPARMSPLPSRSSPTQVRTSPIQSETSPIFLRSSPLFRRTSPMLTRSSPLPLHSSPLLNRVSPLLAFSRGSPQEMRSPNITRSTPTKFFNRNSPKEMVEKLSNRVSPIINEVITNCAKATESSKSVKNLERISQKLQEKTATLVQNRRSADKFSLSRIRGAEVEGWSRTDVEMLESPELERKKYHQSRINQTYSSSTEMAQNVSTNNNDLKRKYSVVPVDDEVKSICAVISKSDFQAAFIMTSNPSHSGTNHKTIDISVVRPNKRVCCTDGTSPPSIRRPSINVDKMAKTVLIRRPVVRKAGQSSRVWSTERENGVFRPVPVFKSIPGGSISTIASVNPPQASVIPSGS